MQSLTDKVAVVTGAASGIGFAMARRFAGEGMKIVLADIEESALHHAAAELRDGGADVFPVRTDVSKLSEVEDLAKQSIEHYGKVHLICNNAGVAAAGLIHETTIRDWEWVLGVNLWGVIYGVKVFLPILIEQGEECHIVNTASLAGLISGPGMGIYCVTKHAVVAFSESLYHELRLLQTHVGVSVLCPAWVNTKIVDSERNRPERLQNELQEMSPFTAALHEVTRQVVSSGVEPTTIADRVVAAIKQGDFYILTHPELTFSIQKRMEAIINGTEPKFIPPPGLEKVGH